MRYYRLALILIFVVGCGLEPSGDDSPDIVINQPPPSQPGPQTPGPGPAVTWSSVRPIVQEQCALSGCHSGARFVATESAFKASKSGQVIANGRMPPTFSPNYDLWSDAKKRTLLDFIKQ